MNSDARLAWRNVAIFLSITCIIVGGVVVRPLMYLAFLYCVGLVVFTKSNAEIYSLLYFLLPFATIFKFYPGSTSLLTFVLLIYELRLIIAQREFPKDFFLFWFLYFVYVLIGMGSAYTDAVKQIFIPIFFFFGMQDNIRKSVKTYSIAYTNAVIITSILAIFRHQIPNLESFVNVKTTRMDVEVFVQRFSGLWGDPNYYSTNLILAFTLTMYFHLKGIYSFKRAMLYYSALTVFGAMTGSKTFLIMLGIVFIFLIIEAFKNGRYVIGLICISAGASVVFLVLNGTITAFNTTIDRLINSADSLSSLTTFRSDLWINYLNTFLEYPLKALIGNGLGKGYTYTAPHNTIIDYIDIYGLIGSGLFLLTCYTVIREKAAAKRLLNYIPAIALFILYCTLSMIRYFDYPFQITIVCMLIYSAHMEEFDNEEGRSVSCI